MFLTPSANPSDAKEAVENIKTFKGSEFWDISCISMYEWVQLTAPRATKKVELRDPVAQKVLVEYPAEQAKISCN